MWIKETISIIIIVIIIIITIIVMIIIIILWDFNIWMGNIIERRRPDMIIIDKIGKRKKAQTVGFTVPADPRIEITQKRKIENYQDLKHELQSYGTWKPTL